MVLIAELGVPLLQGPLDLLALSLHTLQGTPQNGVFLLHLFAVLLQVGVVGCRVLLDLLELLHLLNEYLVCGGDFIVLGGDVRELLLVRADDLLEFRGLAQVRLLLVYHSLEILVFVLFKLEARLEVLYQILQIVKAGRIQT